MQEYGSTDFPMVRYVPYMGVIWTVNEASKLGFYNGHPDWYAMWGRASLRWERLKGA